VALLARNVGSFGAMLREERALEICKRTWPRCGQD
jgi:hypothetical protein